MLLRMYRTIRYFLMRVLIVGEGMLTVRVIARVSAAREEAPAVQLVIRLSEPLIFPFKNIFPFITLGKQSVIDTVTLTAMVGYFLLFIFIDCILKMLLRHD